MKRTEMNLVEFISSWEYNEGEFEELMVQLAEGKGIEDIEIRVLGEDNDTEIAYDIWLNKGGKDIADAWSNENGYTACYDEKGYFEYVDQDTDSAQNTIKELGL